MSWISLIIKTDADHAESLSEVLLEQGALSVDIHDAAADSDDEQMLFGEPGEPTTEIWQNAEVSALFDQETDMTAMIQMIADTVPFTQQPSYRLERVEEQDWVRLTQSQFNPIQISSRLWIVPTWHQPPDETAINLILDPGLAFGTGSHPTTQLCLTWLDRNLKSGDTVLDYGCGSGILAIAALKLGARHVIGIDIDPHAVEASQENAARNSCPPSEIVFSTDYRTVTGDLHAAAQVDIVVANILTNALIVLAPILTQATRQGGVIVLSGILKNQAEEVNRAYQQWFDMTAPIEQDGWVLLTGIKK